MRILEVLGGVIASAVAFCVGVILIAVLTLGMNQFFAPKFAAVQREVFENTPSYVQGKVSDLVRYKLEYEVADKDHKIALRQVIKTTAAQVDQRYLTDDLRTFVNSL